MSQDDALFLIFSRNAFYQRLHYLALAAFGLVMVAIIILANAIYFFVNNPPEPLYFAADEIGRLLPIDPLTSPNMSTNDAAAWAIEAVQKAYSYDYLSYYGQLQNAQKYFTNYGWSKYMSALSASNNLLALKQQKMVIVAQVVDQPQLITQGILSGAYAWKFQLPVLVTYMKPPYDDKSKFSNALQVTVVVQRQRILQSYKGLGIVQMIATMAGVPNQSQEISNNPNS